MSLWPASFLTTWIGRCLAQFVMHEHLRHVKVAEADVGAYRTLLAGVGGDV